MDEYQTDTFTLDSDNVFDEKLDKLCRACLTKENHLQSLFTDDCAERFFYCTSLKIAEHDGLPSWLCQSCFILLNQLYNFKQQCCQSDIIIKNNLNSNKVHYDTVKIEKSDVIESKPDILHSMNNLEVFGNSEGSLCNSIDDSAHRTTDVFDTQFPLHTSSSAQIDELEMLKNDCNNYQNQIKKKPVYLFAKKIFKCNFCPKAFKSDGRLDKHKELHSKTMKPPETNNQNIKSIHNPKKSQLTCSTCNQRFFKYHKLEAHMREHFGLTVEGVNCQLCSKKLKNSESLRMHMITHSGEKKYRCITCSKMFAYKCALIVHEKIHLGIKKYICHICGDKFAQDANLKIHILRHTGEKPHACKRCDKRFTQTGDLKRHMLRHEGIKNFLCPTCPLRFCSKQELAKHMLTHSLTKPFACEICGKTFKTQSFIAIHRRTHTGERPFECEFCFQKFMAGKDLRNHRMIHTGEKPHKCQICSQAFIQKSALNRHMKCHNRVQNNSSNQPSPTSASISDI